MISMVRLRCQRKQHRRHCEQDGRIMISFAGHRPNICNLADGSTTSDKGKSWEQLTTHLSIFFGISETFLTRRLSNALLFFFTPTGIFPSHVRTQRGRVSFYCEQLVEVPDTY